MFTSYLPRSELSRVDKFLDLPTAFLDPFLMTMEFFVLPVSRATSVVKSAFSSDSMKI
jgi:hypothetical protein